MRRHVRSRSSFALLLAAGCAAPAATRPTPAAPAASAAPAPAPTLAPDLGKRVVAERAVVTSANPQASEAGLEMLRRGGNAVDAAVATAFAVSVGEPQMSGLGGGGSMLIWLQQERRAEYLDFYAAQRPDTWRGRTRADTGRTDLREVAIPGTVAGLLAAHERYGRLPRADVLAPAIRLAEEGYAVNQILAQMIASDSAKLWGYPRSRATFWPDGRRLQAGDWFRQPELATTLRAIAERGRAGFDAGPAGASLVRQLAEGGHPATSADLAAFAPQWKRPMCGEYRGRVVLSAAPPQTGLQIVHTLELLEPYDLRALGLPTQSARAFDVLTSALRVGMTVASVGQDPNWSPAPVTGVVAPGYVATRRALVGTGQVPARVVPADPAPYASEPPPAACAPFEPYRATAAHDGDARDDASRPTTRGALDVAPLAAIPAGGETTHLSVVDAEGNAVALTQTNSSTFGVGDRAEGGFMLNDSGVDHARAATDTVPLRAGRHPFAIRRSTISPTIVLDGERVTMVVGAPGGGRIPTEILQTMVYVLDYGLDPLEALRLPRIYPSPTSPTVQLEHGFPAAVLGEIRRMGWAPTAEASGYARLYMIVRAGDRWIGVADPRHDGEARGW